MAKRVENESDSYSSDSDKNENIHTLSVSKKFSVDTVGMNNRFDI